MMRIALVGLAFGILVSGAFLFSRTVLAQASPTPILGYAWSDTIGWIDLNCANSGVCGSYPFGFTVDSTGIVSGYAWSDNIGWVSASASDLAGCPAAPCTATLFSSAFSGWIKALSGGTSQSGGWDGFISLSGVDYGATENNGQLSGFAWGSTVVGWLDFALALGQCTPVLSCVGNAVHNSCTGVDTQCLPDEMCSYDVCLPPEPLEPPEGSISVTPLVRMGATAEVIWNASNVSSCSVTENNPSINDVWTGASGTSTSSLINQATTYTLSCTGHDASAFVKRATAKLAPVFRER